MRIVLTGGGSGGHIYPILAVEREIKKQLADRQDAEFLFIGPKGELEKVEMAKEMIPVREIQCGKMRRYFSGRNFIDFFKIPVGIAESLWHLLVFMPDAVFAKGGFASVPVAIAAWMYRIPVLIHESDILPGLANQILSKIASRVAVSFPGSERFFPERKVFLAGNPIREEFLRGSVDEAKKIFSLGPDKKVILVIGGSQGSRAINRAVTNLLPKILQRWQLIHIIGKKEYDSEIQQAAKLGFKAGREGYHPFPFLGAELPHAIAAADLVVSRAGAGALTEVAANGKPLIVVPIDGSANHHQEQNAFLFSQAGAAILLEQNNLGQNIFMERLEQILGDKEVSYELSEKVKKFYNPRAAGIIADEIIKLGT